MSSYKDQLYGYYYNEMALAHHGVQGQRWGVRRFQNPDGSLTSAGKKRLETNKSLASEFRSDAKDYASRGRFIKAHAANRAANRFQRNADKLVKAEYKSAKGNIKDTRKKLLERDVDRISDDKLYGKISRQEARRRETNADSLRRQQARAHRMTAKSEMNAKLAENSTGLTKTIRQAKSKHEAKVAESANKNAADTKKMINVTNDVYKKRLGSGEKFLSDYLLSDSARNRYFANRANSSVASSAGRAVVDTILDNLTYAYLYS